MTDTVRKHWFNSVFQKNIRKLAGFSVRFLQYFRTLQALWPT